jgi:hypothetical protein
MHKSTKRCTVALHRRQSILFVLGFTLIQGIYKYLDAICIPPQTCTTSACFPSCADVITTMHTQPGCHRSMGLKSSEPLYLKRVPKRPLNWIWVSRSRCNDQHHNLHHNRLKSELNAQRVTLETFSFMLPFHKNTWQSLTTLVVTRI